MTVSFYPTLTVNSAFLEQLVLKLKPGIAIHCPPMTCQVWLA